MPVDDRDAVLTTFTAFRPELVLHGGALTAVDRCETEVDARLRRERHRHPQRGRGGRAGGRPRGLRVDRLRLRRHRRPALPGVGRPVPDVGLRRLQAGGRAGVPARVHHRAHELGVRRPRRQHGRDRPAPGRRRRRAALRRRPARVAHLHGRPGAGHRDPRPRPPARDLPRHQQRRHHLVGLRAGGAGRGRRRSRAGAADQHRRARPAPPGAPPGQLGARQHGAAPERPAGPARLAGRPGPAGARPPARRRRRHEPLGQRPRRIGAPVAVIGAGYVGLPTAATLAHFGHHVVLAEREPSRLSALRSGRMPIVEAGLDELVAEGVAAGNLSLHRLGGRGGGRGASSSSCACRRPRAPTARPTCPTSRRRPRRSRRTWSPAPSSSTSRPCRSARPTWSSR